LLQHFLLLCFLPFGKNNGPPDPLKRFSQSNGIWCRHYEQISKKACLTYQTSQARQTVHQKSVADQYKK